MTVLLNEAVAAEGFRLAFFNLQPADFVSAVETRRLRVRRANASKAFLVSRSIGGNRITVESMGQSNPITDAPGVAGQAPIRRAIFRLLIVADPVKQ